MSTSIRITITGLVGLGLLFFAATAALAHHPITRSEIANGAVNSVKIANNSIGARHIAVNAVGSSEIAANAVGASEIAANAVGASEIAANAVRAVEIAANAVGSSEIGNGTIATIDIADGAITAAKLDGGGVIPDGSITTAKLAADAVTSAKIAADTIVAGDIATGAVTTTEILDGTIATADIAASAITTTEIAADTIVAGDIATGAVTTTEILDGTIATADIAASAITTTEIAADTIVAGDIATGAVTTAEILDGTILVGDFATGAVDSAAILNDSIVNADVNTTAAIAGTKISPDFGSQAITTSGTSSLTGGTVVDSGLLSLGTISPEVKLDVSANTGRVAGLQINLLNTAGSVTGFRGIDSRVTDNGTAAYTVGVQGFTKKESGVSTAEGWGGNFILTMTGGKYEDVWGVVGDVTVGATSSVGSAVSPAVNNLNAGLFQSYVDTGATLSSVMIDAPVLANIKGGATNDRAKADAGVMVMLSVLPGGGNNTAESAFAVRDYGDAGDGFDYGLNLFFDSGPFANSFAIADIQLQNGETIDNSVDGTIDFGAANLVTTGAVDFSGASSLRVPAIGETLSDNADSGNSCAAGNKGDIRIDAANNFFGCDGTNWQILN